MSWIHSFLDRSSRPTWQYERAVRVLLETLLLVACAAPVVTGWRSLVAQVVVGVLRLHQAETSREVTSIKSRVALLDPVTDLFYSKNKLDRLNVLARRDAIITWVWPVLVPIVQALETNALGWMVVVGIIATLIRVAFDRIVMPAWRKSRVEWRKRVLIGIIIGTNAPQEIKEEALRSKL